MPAINVDKEEFTDIVMNFLLDNIRDGGKDLSIDSDDFNVIIEKMKKCGLKVHLTYAYINSDPTTRSKYKMIRKAFTGDSSGKYTITIQSKKERKDTTSKEKETILKTIVKKSLKLIKSHKTRYGQLITEDTVDRLIDKIIKENM